MMDDDRRNEQAEALAAAFDRRERKRRAERSELRQERVAKTSFGCLALLITVGLFAVSWPVAIGFFAVMVALSVLGDWYDSRPATPRQRELIAELLADRITPADVADMDIDPQQEALTRKRAGWVILSLRRAPRRRPGAPRST